MEFDDFFQHPFVKPRVKASSASSTPSSSKPVPVPVTSRTPSLESPACSPGSYGSPIMMMHHRHSTSPSKTHGRTDAELEERLRLRRLRELNADQPISNTSSSSDEQLDDFVVVPKPKDLTSSSPSRRDRRSYSLPDPVPVPSQKENYDRIMMKSRQRESLSSVPEDLKDDDMQVGTRERKDTTGSSPRFSSADMVQQLTPPEVTFVIGTPPSAGSAGSYLSARRTSMPMLNVLPQQQQPGLQRQMTPPYNLALTPLSSIRANNSSSNLNRSPVTSPLVERRGSQLFGSSGSLGRNITLDVSHGVYQQQFQQQPHPGFQPGTSLPISSHHNPYHYSTSSGHHHPYQHYHPHGSSCCCVVPSSGHHHHVHVNQGIRPISAPFASPPADFFMEDPDHFVPPELPAETLLDRGHNETLAKLNFALALVECLMNLADSKGSPLTIVKESDLSSPTGRRRRNLVSSEVTRKAEQLVLYIRCLHLVSSALQLSKQEILNGKLKTSSSVRNG